MWESTYLPKRGGKCQRHLLVNRALSELNRVYYSIEVQHEAFESSKRKEIEEGATSGEIVGNYSDIQFFLLPHHDDCK